MKQTTFLIKPASSLCDMRCRYCFYEDVAAHRSRKSLGLMQPETVEVLLRKAYAATDRNGSISFMFQGGEPMLAGLPFFEQFIALEKAIARPDVQVQHAIQTNGMAIDDAWAVFFKANDFLVGLSMDGTAALHDLNRVDAQGKGSWERAVNALRILEHHGVETNILCVVTRQLAKKPQEVYRTLRDLGNHALQFIPCLDPLDSPRGSFPHSLTPGLYGKFLCGLFDCWHRDLMQRRYVSIRIFDDYLRILMGLAPTSCAASGSCGHYLVAEGDGSLYPCDFYVLDEWCLGNIHDLTVEEALASPISRRFLEEGQQRPAECRACPYRMLCRGGCRRDWSQAHHNDFCTAYRLFFEYALPRMQAAARMMR